MSNETPATPPPRHDGALSRLAPGVDVARHYRRAWLRRDLVAGAVLTALLVPAGLGYAQASGLPPVTGLYASIVPLVVYAVIGPSRILVLGPDSALAPIIAATVLPLAAGDESRAVALAGLLALMMGGLLVLGGLVRIGVVTDLLSKPIRVGYLNGIALVVIAGQLPKLLGISGDGTSVGGALSDVVDGIRAGQLDVRATLIGAGALAVVVACRLLHSPVPGVALVVIASVVLTWVCGWQDDVAVVGSLPRGLPRPALGGLGWGDVGSLMMPALGIAFIAFADTGIVSRAFAARHGASVDGSQEMAAIGTANLVTGATGGFPVLASPTRTAVAESAGARTQLCSLVGAGLIVAFVLLAPGVTGYLPTSALAAIVIVAASTLVDVRTLWWLVRVEPVDAALSLAGFVGVVLVGVLPGIAIAVALSLVAFVNRAWRPYRAELGRIPGVRGYHDVSRHVDAVRIPGITIVRFDAPLFFANGGLFEGFVRSVVERAPGTRVVILAAEPITEIDTTAVDQLVRLDDFLATRGIDLVIAEMKGPVKDQLERYGLADRFGPERFAPTVGAAVDAITGTLRGDLDLAPDSGPSTPAMS